VSGIGVTTMPIPRLAVRWAGPAATVLLLAAVPLAASHAVDWQLNQSASARITFTDNVDLDPDDQAEEALVPSLTYTIAGTGQGGRVLFWTDSRITAQSSTEDNKIQIDQSIDALGRVEVVNDRLFLDASITSFQELLDSGSSVSSNPNSGRNQQSSVTSLSVSPIYQHRFGTWSDAQFSYQHSEIIASGSRDDARSDSVRLTAAAGSRFTFWKPSFTAGYLNYVEDLARPSNSKDDVEQVSVQLDNAFQMTRNFALLGTVGYDDVDAPSSSKDLSGPFWSVGASGTPGPRSQYTFQIGQRFGEVALTGNANYLVTPNLVLRLNATHDVGTALQRGSTQVQRLTVQTLSGGLATNNGLPAGFLRGNNLDDGLSTRQSIGFGLVGTYGRNSITFGSGFDITEFDDGTDRTSTTRLGWTRQLSRLTSLSLGGFYRYVDQRTRASTNAVGARADLSYSLGPTTSVFTGISRTDRFSSDPNEEFTENALTIGGRITF
jgi:uncharacterized protein (PEP-CTERM system associated)